MARATCHVISLGVVEYGEAWRLQRALVDAIKAREVPNTLLLLQHPHVYTLGRRGDREHVLLDDSQLEARGIALQEADRGGQVTYHGPGQLVAYPVVSLRSWEGPVRYVRALEQAMLATLAQFGIDGGLVEGRTGVWVGHEKIGAIGVKISGGIAYHGLALNVCPDLSYFQHIIPCGITDAGVTSIERLLGDPVDIYTVAYGLTYHLGRELDLQMVEEPTTDALAKTLQPIGGAIATR